MHVLSACRSHYSAEGTSQHSAVTHKQEELSFGFYGKVCAHPIRMPHLSGTKEGMQYYWKKERRYSFLEVASLQFCFSSVPCNSCTQNFKPTGNMKATFLTDWSPLLLTFYLEMKLVILFIITFNHLYSCRLWLAPGCACCLATLCKWRQHILHRQRCESKNQEYRSVILEDLPEQYSGQNWGWEITPTKPLFRVQMKFSTASIFY